MSWERTERTLRELRNRCVDASTPEQYQAVGQLGRDTLISLAQAVFRPEIHWRGSDPIPSATDSKRQLESYLTVSLPGSSKEELRSYARSAVQLADALTHRRSANRQDARIVLIAVDAMTRLIAVLENHQLSDSDAGWEGVNAGNRFFAWDGPNLHALPDRQPMPAPLEAIEALRAAGHKPVFGVRDKLYRHQASGAFQVWETDRVSWRRELLQPVDGQILMVRPNVGGDI
jgi:hypothetical protein